jgi:hypothetical protein
MPPSSSLGLANRGALLYLHSKVRAPEFAHLAAYAILRARYISFTLIYMHFQHLLGAKGDANAAALTPLFVYRNVKLQKYPSFRIGG